MNTKDNIGKFDPKSGDSIFLGYSNTSTTYRLYNKRTLVVEESMHVMFDEFNLSSIRKLLLMMMHMKSYNKKNRQMSIEITLDTH